MLAAGVGERLAGDLDKPPKILLRFDGRTLLERHVDILRRCGVKELVLVVGYRADLIEEEIRIIGADELVRTICNPDFRGGSVVSLSVGGDALNYGTDVLLMDADVLYDYRMIDRLVDSAHANCFLMDRDYEEGDEPVKLCLRDGQPVEFRKQVTGKYDICGESVGFFRFTPAIAKRVIQAAEGYVQTGRRDAPYEEALRDVLRSSREGTFGYEDITGLPWIEIDFPEDVVRAREVILPNLLSGPR